MSSFYNPDDTAFPDAINAIKLLSQRDVALHIPVNFVPVAGVSLSTCNIGLRYELSALKCFSNLLAAGFRRFDLDIYWDESRMLWSACPVQLATNGASPSSSATSQTSAANVTGRARPDASGLDNQAGRAITGRQALSVSSQTRSILSTETIQSPSSTVTLRPSTTAAPSGSTADLVQVGDIVCSQRLTFDAYLAVLIAHLEATENNLNATTSYLTLNIFAARNIDASRNAAPSRLPGNDQTLSALISTNASDYLYTPADLQSQRANLNATGSWYNVPQNVLPVPSYFTVSSRGGTSDGWPTESFIEFTRLKRLLVTFGTVQGEMAGYNLSADGSVIFQQGYLTNNRAYSFSDTGALSNGCFYNAASANLQNSNNSWAFGYTEDARPQLALAQAGNLTECGFTPVLNASLSNVTAGQDSSTYEEFALKSIWSWDAPEPRPNAGHCAVLNANTGRWQVEGCSAAHRAACDTGTPYGWQISTQSLSYDRIDQACPAGSKFGVSRTALENRYLISAWREARARTSISDELLWINLNDISVPGCWVEGQNTTCPYQPQDDSNSRTIIVPTVSGVIILVLTILTIIIKCGSNRRATRRRRRRAGEMIEYEGVPS